MTEQEIWDNDEPVGSVIDIEIPLWVQSDISCADIAAIVQGGCDSGAYMPAVTYWQALETMSEHGDEVMDYLYEPPAVPEGLSWAGMACVYVSAAVENWAGMVMDDLRLEDAE